MAQNSNNFHWFNDQNNLSWENYSRISTCLALSQAVYAPTAEACVKWLNDMKDSLSHGVKEVLYSCSDACERQYLIAFKPITEEIYITFRGTENWRAFIPSLKVCAKPNDFQGTLHSGYSDAANAIPSAPFCHLLRQFPNYKLIYTGHSLGGAIAAIVTLNMLIDIKNMQSIDRIFCVAFGSPFIANDKCSKYIDERYQHHFQFYINHNDIIPYLLTFVYSKDEELPSESPKEIFNSVFPILDAALAENESKNGILFSTAKVIRKCLTTSVSFILLNQISKYLLPMYKPFGMCYRTASRKSENTEGTEFYIEHVTSEYFSEYRNNTDDDIVVAFQDHFCENYIREIHGCVIQKNIRLAKFDIPMVYHIENSNEFSCYCLYSLLVPNRDTQRWRHKDTDCKSEDLYSWSIVSTRDDEKEEITLRLYGLNVHFITSLKCERLSSVITPLDNDDDCLRVFIFSLLKQQHKPKTDDYRFHLKTHFGDIDLTGLFNPDLFTSTNGMKGRRKQIAELNVLELYKLAFAYCTFTGKTMQRRNNNDTDRRFSIEDYLILCENELLQIGGKKFEETIKEERLKEIAKVIGKSVEVKEDASLAFSFQFLDIRTVMSSWYETTSKRNSTQTVYDVLPRLFCMNATLTEFDTCRFEDKGKKVLSAMVLGGVVASVITAGALFYSAGAGAASLADIASRIELINFSTKFNSAFGIVGQRATKYMINALTAGPAAAAATSATLGTVALAGGSAAGLTGSVAYISDVLQQDLTQTTKQYAKTLGFIAKSLGVILDRLPADPYSLEKEVSLVCSQMPSRRYSSHVLQEDDLESFSPTTKSRMKNLDDTRKKQYLSIIRCINANYQIRELLSKDFALGVVGPGKTGKSTLIRNMFGFNTNPSAIARTEDLCSYPVNDCFRVVDFPHSTDIFDDAKNCFQFNHTFVNALIVVLNAEQTGRDAFGEQSVVKMIEKLTKDTGVDVLYCFNKIDKLALEINTSRRAGGTNILKSIREGKVNQSTATTVQHEVRKQWTDEDSEKRKFEWSTRKMEWAKHYGLEPSQCLLTFCNDERDDQKYRSTYDTLRKLDLYSPLEIKEEWLKKVLKENDVPEDSIEEIMQCDDG